VARQAGIIKTVTPHTLQHAFITAAQVGRIASDATFPGKCDREAAGA
jgi:hypothetical protein